MKTAFMGIFLVILVLGSAMPAQSSLTQYNALVVQDDRGTVGDTTDDMYWLSNLATFVSYDYNGQITQISLLNNTPDPTNPWGDWHMASRDEMTPLWIYSAAEIDSVFSPARISYGNNWYDARYDRVSGPGRHSTAQVVKFSGGTLSKSGLDSSSVLDTSTGAYGAWVVAAANPVPIPAAVWLLGSGLLGLVGLRKKLKK